MKFFTLVVLIALYCVNEGEAAKKYVCMKCKSSSSSSDCQKGTATDTCEGKICYAYVYLENISTFLGGTNKKRWWIRGCTEDKEFCDTGSHVGCTICKGKDKCNSKPLTKYMSKN
ncbi:uncharacterized protein LOC123315848 [Coccinella septempunctata]|uniref:uncharacterized protein LOC123315848 n=1 Tax=Coccinella septempunctata TaxID=41139 RepID=UPI001D07EE17|nr:uncharacterized protein LOC123315848 [Coccinella septempunctata]